jgi:hypothetical protein
MESFSCLTLKAVNAVAKFSFPDKLRPGNPGFRRYFGNSPGYPNPESR